MGIVSAFIVRERDQDLVAHISDLSNIWLSEISENLPIRKLTSEQNEMLKRPFTIEEVERVIREMTVDKAPRPDGMTGSFYKQGWKVMRDDMMDAFMNFYNFTELHRAINQTFIALIPKVENPRRAKDFRPISLCNEAYNILARVLVNRLSLESLIADQSQKTIEKTNDFKQPGERYRSWAHDRQERFVRRWVEALAHPKVSHEIRTIWITYLSKCDASLGQKVASHLNMKPTM